MFLGQQYHWSPADRFPSILAHGLQPGSPHVTCTAPCDFVCVSPDPKRAWELSGALADVSGYQASAWDLWQVHLAESDEIHVRAEYGPTVQEIQIRNPIPAERLWHIGRRPAAIDG